jgi:hypothetical protein
MTPHHIFDDQPPHCPRCARDRVLPVVYQPPSEEMLTAEKLGLIALGAPSEISSETSDAPEWKCQDETCGYLF